jgi:hypothetical protein
LNTTEQDQKEKDMTKQLTIAALQDLRKSYKDKREDAYRHGWIDLAHGYEDKLVALNAKLIELGA